MLVAHAKTRGMAMDNRLTTNSQESHFGALLEGNKYYKIPPFQREYKWKRAQIDNLVEDLERLADGEEDAHFMGAIIMDQQPTGPAEPTVYEVIDGQQRLTTVYLMICAAVEVLLRQNQTETAGSYAVTYIMTREGVNKYKSSLVPSLPDQGDLNWVIDQLWEKGLKSQLVGSAWEKLPLRERRNGQVEKVYQLWSKYLSKVYKSGGMGRLEAMMRAALTGLTAVQIVVKDPTSGPKIFDSLNSKQEPMTTGDLVRNEVFGKIARTDPIQAQALDKDLWQPFYGSFIRDKENTFEGFFFPYGLIKDPQFKKSEVYPGLRKLWADRTPTQVIEELESYRKEYQDLVFGENACNHAAELAAAKERLHRLKFPRVALPFLMEILRAVATEQLPMFRATELVSAVESFLVRRALCSIEPTGLHAVFKRLWADVKDNPEVSTFWSEIARAKTVFLPTDNDVREALNKPLYGKGIDRYFVFEFDFSLGGDPVPFADMEVEHVLPRSYHAANWSLFSAEEHQQLKDLAGNLVAITPPMNKGVNQDAYELKCKTYKNDSKFKSAREFARLFGEWTPDSVQERTRDLAEWAVLRWPMPTP